MRLSVGEKAETHTEERLSQSGLSVECILILNDKSWYLTSASLCFLRLKFY